jgi:hypothetical protein
MIDMSQAGQWTNLKMVLCPLSRHSSNAKTTLIERLLFDGAQR